MKVRVGARFPDGRPIEVEMEESDMRADYPEWDTYQSARRYRLTAAKADLYVLDYLHRNGQISDDYFQDRIAAINASLKSVLPKKEAEE